MTIVFCTNALTSLIQNDDSGSLRTINLMIAEIAMNAGVDRAGIE
jgi:hypothetical protein